MTTLPGESVGIGAAHAAAAEVSPVASPGRPPRVSSSPAPRLPSPHKTMHIKGAGKDGLPADADAHAYIAWRQGKASALAAVMQHLSMYGGVEVSGAAAPTAPEIPSLEAAALMRQAARKDVQGVEGSSAIKGSIRAPLVRPPLSDRVDIG